jgi:hypothetical protein
VIVELIGTVKLPTRAFPTKRISRCQTKRGAKIACARYAAELMREFPRALEVSVRIPAFKRLPSKRPAVNV